MKPKLLLLLVCCLASYGQPARAQSGPETYVWWPYYPPKDCNPNYDITMRNAWGWVPHDRYKSTRELVQLLIRIVAKGGNLLLGVGPDGKGEFDPKVYERFHELGQWLKVNGDAIYQTVPVEPFQEGKIAYTARSNEAVFALYLPDKYEKEIPAELVIKTKLPGRLAASLPAFNQGLSVTAAAGAITVVIPVALRGELAKQPAVVVRINNK